MKYRDPEIESAIADAKLAFERAKMKEFKDLHDKFEEEMEKRSFEEQEKHKATIYKLEEKLSKEWESRLTKTRDDFHEMMDAREQDEVVLRSMITEGETKVETGKQQLECMTKGHEHTLRSWLQNVEKFEDEVAKRDGKLQKLQRKLERTHNENEDLTFALRGAVTALEISYKQKRRIQSKYDGSGKVIGAIQALLADHGTDLVAIGPSKQEENDEYSSQAEVRILSDLQKLLGSRNEEPATSPTIPSTATTASTAKAATTADPLPAPPVPPRDYLPSSSRPLMAASNNESNSYHQTRPQQKRRHQKQDRSERGIES